MITIQIVLVSGFLILLVLVFSTPEGYRIQFWKKILAIVFVCFAILSIIYPNILNRAAHFTGVGRGADLLLYVLTLSLIFVLLNSYLQFKKKDLELARVIRRLAIVEANQDERNKKILRSKN